MANIQKTSFFFYFFLAKHLAIPKIILTFATSNKKDMDLFNKIVEELGKLGYDVFPTSDNKEYCIAPPVKVSSFWHRCDKNGVFEYYNNLSKPKKEKPIIIDENTFFVELGNGNFTKADIVNDSLEKAKIQGRAFSLGKGHKQVKVYCETDISEIKIISKAHKVTFSRMTDFMGNVMEKSYWGYCTKNDIKTTL